LTRVVLRPRFCSRLLWSGTAPRCYGGGQLLLSERNTRGSSQWCGQAYGGKQHSDNCRQPFAILRSGFEKRIIFPSYKGKAPTSAKGNPKKATGQNPRNITNSSHLPIPFRVSTFNIYSRTFSQNTMRLIQCTVCLLTTVSR
jgi:hypothetical protein